MSAVLAIEADDTITCPCGESFLYWQAPDHAQHCDRIVIAGQLMPVRPRCPECHAGTLELVTDGHVGRTVVPGYFVVGSDAPRIEMVSAPFFACNACEFCIEVNPRDLRAKE